MRSAPLPEALRTVPLANAEAAYDPAVLGAALGGLLRVPAPIDLSHMAMPRVTVGERLADPARPAAPRHASASTTRSRTPTASPSASRVFALLELYKRGEAAWEQDEPFGPITVTRRRAAARRRRMNLAAHLEALLFLAPEPVSVEELADALQSGEEAVTQAADELEADLEGRGLVLRRVAGGLALASHPDAEEAARRLLARPRTPALTPAQAETLAIVAYLQPVSRPEVARIRGVASESATSALVERGLIEEAGRSQFGAVLYRTTPLFLKLFGLDSPEAAAGHRPVGPAPEEADRAARPPAPRGRGPRRSRRGALGRFARPRGHQRRRADGRLTATSTLGRPPDGRVEDRLRSARDDHRRSRPISERTRDLAAQRLDRRRGTSATRDAWRRTTTRQW